MNRKKNRGEKIVTDDSQKKKPWKPQRELSMEAIEEINKKWEDNPTTSTLWEIISQDRAKELIEILTEYPEVAHVRSSDGRGPLFWAMEFGNKKIVRILKKVGVLDTVKDAKGMRPSDLARDEL